MRKTSQWMPVRKCISKTEAQAEMWWDGGDQEPIRWLSRALRCLLGHKQRGCHTSEEDESEQAKEALLLGAQVGGQGAGVPVNGGQEVAQASPEADHESVDGESLATVVRVPEEVREQGLQRSEAHLATEVQQPHTQDQQGQLQGPGVRAQQSCQPAGPWDEEEAQENTQGQGPDEGSPAATAPAPVVTG